MDARALEDRPDDTGRARPAAPGRLLIGGSFVDSLSGKRFAVEDPATGRVICEVAEAGAEDVDLAVAAARRAFEDGPWPRMSTSERGQLLWRLAELLERNGEELARIEALDGGKPLVVARRVDVAWAVEMLRYMAGWATKITGQTIPFNRPGGDYFCYTTREPVGVVAQLIPFNFPLLIAVIKLAPAIAVGCTVIVKPAEQTPLSALRLGELVVEAGFPPGVVNILTGFGPVTGAALAAHDGVDAIAFTGSTAVGKLVAQAAAGNLKKVQLELGGKSPAIADLLRRIAPVHPPQGVRPRARRALQPGRTDEARGRSGRRRRDGSAGVRQAARPGRRVRPVGRGRWRARRRGRQAPGPGRRLLLPPHHPHRHPARHGGGARGDLRPGADRRAV
jgi:hypothetical protein